MATYDVYQHSKTGKYQAVKKGFCWPALFFGGLWAFSRRLYLVGIVIGVTFVFFIAAELAMSSKGFLYESMLAGLRVFLQCIFAWFANDIRVWFIKLRGYEKLSEVSANWYSAAIEQYIDDLNGVTNS